MADLKDLTLRLYKEVFENRNIDAIDDLVAEDVVEHEPPPPGLEMKPGREGVKQLTRAYLDAFSPMAISVLDAYRDGDTVIMRYAFSGTHSGEFGGMPATGKTFNVEGIDILRFKRGRVVEHWGQVDGVGMMAQLGVMPSME